MYTELVESLFESAVEMIPDITPGEMAIAAAAWLRIQLDGEPESRVVPWARRMLGLESSTGDIVRMHSEGASLRQISSATGISKSSVARLLSQADVPGA